MFRFLLVFALAGAMFGAEAFIKNDTKLFSSDKTELAQLDFATPVSVLKEAGELSLVRLDGWVVEGSEDAIYLKDGVVLELAVLSENGAKQLTTLSSKEDEYGTKWLQISVEGWVKTLDLSSEVATEFKGVARLYEQKCSSCHALHPVSHFDANAWPSMIEAMSERAAMSPEQSKKVLKYLQFSTINNPN